MSKKEVLKLLLTPAGKKGAWKKSDGDSWESKLAFSLKGGWEDVEVELIFKGAEDQLNALVEHLKALTPAHKIGIRLYPSNQTTLDEFTPKEET